MCTYVDRAEDQWREQVATSKSQKICGETSCRFKFSIRMSHCPYVSQRLTQSSFILKHCFPQLIRKFFWVHTQINNRGQQGIHNV